MSTAGTPIAWPLRAWLVVEIGFGLAAISSITVAPQDTATNFAWPIKPEVTAALLGAFYLSSAGMFVLAAFAGRWEWIRVMTIPAIVFTSIELLATFLHWDRFSVGTTPFYVWFASYLLPPPIFTACYLWHQRRARPAAIVQPIPRPVRVVMMAIGLSLVAEGVAAFVFPQILVATAPWPFTPLTARALSGWLVALGCALVFAAREGDRSRAIVVSPFFILIGPIAALQTARFADQVDWAHPRIAIAGVVLTAIFGIGVHLATGNWRELYRRADPGHIEGRTPASR